jgi:PAS domain S-box-containing protein
MTARDRITSSRRLARTISGIVLLLLIPPWLWLVDGHRLHRLDEDRGTVREIAQLHTSALQQSFDRVELELQALREFIETQLATGSSIDEHDIATYCAALTSNSSHVRAFQTVSGGVIANSWPETGNESAIGFDLEESPIAEVKDDWIRASEQAKMTVTGPVRLLQGIDGLIVRQRLQLVEQEVAEVEQEAAASDKAEQLGPPDQVAVVIALASLLQDAGLEREHVPDLDIAVRGEDGRAIFGEVATFERDPVKRLIYLPEGTWELAVVPVSGWPTMFEGDSILVAGFSGLAVCLVVLLVYAVTMRNANLTVAVEQRTKELVCANQQLASDLQLRQAAEARLRENETRLKSLFDTEPACIKVVSQDGRVLSMNRAGLELLDCDSAEQVLNRPTSQFIAPEFQSACLKAHQRVLSGSQEQLEFQIISLQGKRRWVDSRIIPVRDAEGKINRTLAITRDITETRNAQDALRNSERQFRSMFEQAAVGVIQYESSTGRVINLNNRLCQMLQSDKRTLQRQLMQDIFGSGYRSRTAGELLLPADRQQSTVREVELTLPDSTSLWVRLTSSASSEHPDDYGNVTTVVEDVTQQRRDAESLQQRDMILNAVAIAAARLLTADDPMKLIDSVLRELGRATHSSRAYYFARHADASDQPVVTQVAEWCAEGIEPQIHREDLQSVNLHEIGYGRWDQEFSLGQPVRGRVKDFPVAEQRRLLDQGIQSLLVLPVSQTRQWQGFIGFDDCQTERVWSDGETGALQIAAETLAAAIDRQETEAQRKDLIEQLAQSQKLEAVGQLAGGVAHDFNNMLQVILGYSDIGLTMVADDVVLTEIMTEIRTAARRSAEMTQQLLTFARRQRVEPSQMDLNRAIPRMLKLLQRMVGEHVQLQWLPCNQSCIVKMDPSQLDQILTNLVVNARDAIDGTGTVTISTSIQEPEQSSQQADSVTKTGGSVCLAVQDDGCGMDEAMQSRIFEPFFTTKAVGEGSGLGLSNVYGIVQQSNGTITVHSQIGRGSTFHIHLPLQQSDADRLAAADPVAPLPAGNETVLLVEDEPMVLDFAAQLLEKLGYRVRTFRTPLKALEAAAELPDGADLLVTDVVMPDMDGGELARRLQATMPQLRCLFISGFAPETLRTGLQSDPEQMMLVKPFSAQQLAESVREVLDRQPIPATEPAG